MLDESLEYISFFIIVDQQLHPVEYVSTYLKNTNCLIKDSEPIYNDNSRCFTYYILIWRPEQYLIDTLSLFQSLDYLSVDNKLGI